MKWLCAVLAIGLLAGCAEQQNARHDIPAGMGGLRGGNPGYPPSRM